MAAGGVRRRRRVHADLAALAAEMRADARRRRLDRVLFAAVGVGVFAAILSPVWVPLVR